MRQIGSWTRAVCAFTGAVALTGPMVGLPVSWLQTPAGAQASHALTVSQNNISYQNTTLGDFRSIPFTLTNTSGSTVTIDAVSGYDIAGPGAADYQGIPEANCVFDPSGNITIAASDSCTFDNRFYPDALGARPATLQITDESNDSVTINFSGTGSVGYYQVSASGQIAYFGDAAFYGDASNLHLNRPIEGMAQTGDDGGYWLVSDDGGIFNYGDAGFFGSAGSLSLNKPIVGMAATPDGGGYWLVASDGGIFSYGDAQFYGSTGAIRLNKPIVGMAPTPDGQGYWLVASDGGIFSYGDAQFYGSTGALQLAQPIVGMTAMPDGLGYWFTAADGGLFNYGDAPFSGAANSEGIGNVVAMTTDGAPTLQAFTHQPAIRSDGLTPRAVWGVLRRGLRDAAP